MSAVIRCRTLYHLVVWAGLLVALPARALESWGTPSALEVPAAPARRCLGTYAPSITSLAPSVTAFESQPGKSFVYCLRNTATYEQAYYGRDGKLKKRFLKATAHGTGFAYRWTGQETLLLTNHHVATWPDVTDDENHVKGVPPGARKVSETLQIVRNDEDEYEPGFVNLTRAVTDPTLDASVVKTRQRLNVLPYAIGSSSELKTGNAVEVRGYPLGAFAASNAGKVTNPYVEDMEGSWNHGDFALDALVNSGNSGSPVLAVSCATGEYELVGLFHAGYRGGEAMNLAVGIDDLRQLMDGLTARPRQQKLEWATMTAEARAALAATLTGPDAVRQIRFGQRLVNVSLRDDSVFVFRIYSDSYPEDTQVFVELEEPLQEDELPPRIRVSRALLPPYNVPPEALNAEAREHLQRVITAVLTRVARVHQYRELAGEPPRSMTQHRKSERLLREMHRAEKEQEDMVDVLEALLERARQAGASHAPHTSELGPDEIPAPPRGRPADALGAH